MDSDGREVVTQLSTAVVVNEINECCRVKDQGQTKACCACAVTTAAEVLYPGFEGSFVFADFIARESDTVTPRTALDAATRYGICPEGAWRSTPENYGRRPRRQAYSLARAYRLGSFFPVASVADQVSLARKRVPLILAYDMRLLDRLHLPTQSNDNAHVNIVMGVDEEQQSLVVRNSWGKAWNGNGEFLLPWSDPEVTRLVLECFAVTL